MDDTMTHLNVDKDEAGILSLPSTRTASLAESTSSPSHGNSIGEPVEKADSAASNGSQLGSGYVTPGLLAQTSSRASTMTNVPEYEVDWEGPDDKANPRNWSVWYRGMVIGFVSFSTWVVVVYSTAYTSGIPGLMVEYHIQSETVATLGVTTYLLGLAVGSVVLAPLSEVYGRRPVYIASMLVFMLLVLPCALATSLTEILVVRFFGALAGAAMIANSPGSVSDIADDEYRAFAFSIWSIGPLNGPVFGPLIGGFTFQYLGWRWISWLVLIVSGVALIFVGMLEETYAPAILRKKAKAKRKSEDDPRWWSRYDDKLDFTQLMKVNLSRPFIMMFTEPICIFWDLYVAVIYGILYLCFVAYPVVFSEARGWAPGISGLSFVGIGIGSFTAIFCEPLIRKMINSHKAENGKVPLEATVSIICIAAILAPVGELWFAWTCVPVSIHWAAPIAAGIPFGAGNTLVFIYATSYLAGCYGIYAASALAGNSVIRSLAGGTLPLAGPTLYRTLGPNWAGTLLGLLEVVLIPIPFVFYRYGSKIRMKSTLIRTMREDQERSQRKRDRAEKKGLVSEAAATAADKELEEV